jgi:hypothetical protein
MEDKTMRKMTYPIAALSTLAAVLFWFVAPSGASIGDGRAALEEVFNPFGGTRAQWDALAESGGVQKDDRWNGLPVSKANARFDAAGRVVEVAISTSQLLATVREIREPINRICGFKDQDWKMTGIGNFLSGAAENTRCKARYLPEDEKYWTYSIQRQGKVAT